MYADLHCDTFYKCYTEQLSFDSPELDISAPALKSLTPAIQTFAHYIPENIPDKYVFFQKMLENTLEIIHNTDGMILYKDRNDLLTAEKNGKVLAVLSVENGNIFGENTAQNIERANFLEKNHIRFLSLCYNNGSEICGGANTLEPLTQKGREVVSLLASRNISLDLSHLNNKSASDVLDCNVKAVATHSDCFSLCNHHRNLTDENIVKLCERNSLIGINLYAPFLTKSKTCSLSDVKAHIDRILSLGGQNCIALGADFDGCDIYPHGIQSVSDITKLYEFIPGIRQKMYNNVKNYLLS